MKDFQKAVTISMLVSIILEASGKYYFVTYAIQQFVILIGDESKAFYCIISVDIATVAGLLCSSVIIRYFRRRTLLFFLGYFAASLVFILSIIVFLKDQYGIGNNLVWVSVIIFILYNFINNVGVLPVSFTILGEIFPLEHRGVGTCFSAFIFLLLYTLTLQVTPLMTAVIGIQGTYLVFTMALLISLSWLFIILPDTRKDRTLQDIEDEMKGRKGKILSINDEENTELALI